jgi:SAM-dependent methyltransferase
LPQELPAAAADLEERYRGHPASSTSLWNDEFTSTLKLDSFRAHGPFVWQDRHDHDAYRRSYLHLVERHEALTRSAREDGAFGARCEHVDGKAISRDLLDSVAEIGYLESFASLSQNAEVLDIGAGYGRLGHRLHELGPRTCRVRCVDGVPVSSHICARYLRFRGTTRAAMVPLDEIEESLACTPASIACNVHSFHEMPLSAIEWWLRLLADHDVPLLFLVVNEIGEIRSKEADGSRLDVRPLLADLGFSLIHQAWKYPAASSSADERFVFQTAHMLFARPAAGAGWLGRRRARRLPR